MNLCIRHSAGNFSTILQKRSNPTNSFKMTFTDLKILSRKIPPTFNHWYFKGQFFKSFSFMQKLTSHRRNSSQPKGFSKLRAKQFLLFRFNWKPNPPYCQTFPKLAFCFQTDAVQFNHSKNPKKNTYLAVSVSIPIMWPSLGSNQGLADYESLFLCFIILLV